jgi:cell division protein FtsW
MARKLRVDEWLFGATVGLALFGVVMVYSASSVTTMMGAEGNGVGPYHYVIRQAVWTLIGFGAMFLAMSIDYRVWRLPHIATGLIVLSIVLLVAVFAFPAINGAQRWIRYGPFSMQPSELSKFALICFLARFLERRAGEEHLFWRTFVPAIAVTGILAALVVFEPDLGTAMMLVVVCVVLLYTAGARMLHLALMGVPVLIALVGLLVFVPFRMRRLTSFLDPMADPQGAGYQIVQSLIAIGSGGLGGLGFADGRQKMFFLPFAHSDFIFAVVGEELGLLGALTVLVVFGLFLWRGVRASLLAPDRFGMLLGFGIVTMIIVQALFNISVTIALLPTKGIPLPFISYGGSSLVPTLFAVGILLNISQHATAGSGAFGREALPIAREAVAVSRSSEMNPARGGARI